jgi:diguanylate cyclase (GGDEF)-like protein/PAS domain S-box-containing protein
MNMLTILKPGNKLLQKSKMSKKSPMSNYTHSEMFNLLFEHHPDAIFTLDKNGHFLSCNHSVETFIGYKTNEIKGSFVPLVKKEDMDRVMKHFKMALQGIPQNYNCEVTHKDGHYVHLNITNLPFKVNGELIGVYGFAKDLTHLQEKENELIKVTNSLNLAQRVGSIGSWDYDVENDYVHCSEPLYEILGIKKVEGITTHYHNLLQMVAPEDRAVFDYHFQQTKKTGSTLDVIYKVRRLDEMMINVHVIAQALKDEQGKVYRILGVLQDVSTQVLTESKLKESEEKFEKIARNLDVGIWSMDLLLKKIVYASPGVERLSGFSAVDFLSGKRKWMDLIHSDDVEEYMKAQVDLLKGKMIQHQYQIIDAFGNLKWIEDKVFPIVNSEGELIRVDGIVQDITARKQSEERINFYAFHDYLTELPNRRMFDSKVEQLIANSATIPFALMYLDLDRFKFVNDTLGHGIGDELLRQVSKRLSLFISEKDTLFRIGGDEFTIVVNGCSTVTNPVEVGRKIIKEIEKPFYIDGYEIFITTSIGIGIFPEDGDTITELKQNTDAALYRAKELGKNNVQLFAKTLNIESYKLFTLDQDLRKAIQNEEFLLYYQPKVDTYSGEIIGAEALIRWNHPKWGLVSPVEFIPLAEETGLINEIGDWVIEEVCKQLKEWKVNGVNLVPISINLSAKTLMRTDLVSTIMKHVRTYHIQPSLLEIEITENSIIQNEISVLSTIKLLKDSGISISLDDFGTGYSSIGYLKKFNVDYIKIDRSYIKDIMENPTDSTIVQSIILLAKGFQLKVVAEGVETKEQWELLKELGCHFLQGYLFSKPIEADEFVKLILKLERNMQPISRLQYHDEVNKISEDCNNTSTLLNAAMTIIRMKGEPLAIGSTNVSIATIGENRLSFTSKLQLPITEEMILQFKINTTGEPTTLRGHIIWKQENENNEFLYEVRKHGDGSLASYSI